MNNFISVKEASIKYNLKEYQLRYLLRNGSLKGELTSRKEGWLINETSLSQYINSISSKQPTNANPKILISDYVRQREELLNGIEVKVGNLYTDGFISKTFDLDLKYSEHFYSTNTYTVCITTLINYNSFTSNVDIWDISRNVLYVLGDELDSDQVFNNKNLEMLQKMQMNSPIYLFQKINTNENLYCGKFYIQDYVLTTCPFRNKETSSLIVIFKLCVIS